jgi:hypothetical protein
MRKGSGIGFVVLLIVLAVVMILAARNAKTVAPTALEIGGAEATVAIEDHGQGDAAAELRSGELPRLGEMREETAGHADEVREALEASNQ